MYKILILFILLLFCAPTIPIRSIENPCFRVAMGVSIPIIITETRTDFSCTTWVDTAVDVYWCETGWKVKYPNSEWIQFYPKSDYKLIIVRN